MRRVLTIPLLLFALVYSLANAQECSLLNVGDLGNTTHLSSSGLVAQTLVSAGESSTTTNSVKIIRYKILCDASGSSRNTSRFVSVLVEFVCTTTGSATGNLEGCDGTTMLTRQYQFECGNVDAWVTTVLGNANFVQTLNPTATFSTMPDYSCRACVDNRQVATADSDTHCLACDAGCNEGQMRCYLDGANVRCCNFYQENLCVANCPSSLVSDENNNCGCGTLNLTNGELSYSQRYTLGSVATHTCNSGYRLSPVGGEVRNCTLSGWTGETVTCDFTPCPNLTIANGMVEISPSDRSLNSKATYICNNEYSLAGNRERFCQENNMWSGADPECKKKSTLSPGAIVGIVIAALLAVVVVILIVVVIIIVLVKKNKPTV